MYLAYEDYQNMGGTLDETAFNDFEFEAETIVDWYTFNRLHNFDPEDYPERLKRCMNALIKLAKLKADALAMGAQTTTTVDAEGHTTTTVASTYIASQSNDGVSISYNTISASEAFKTLQSQEAGNAIEDTVKRYLNVVVDSLGRNILYRGLYPVE